MGLKYVQILVLQAYSVCCIQIFCMKFYFTSYRDVKSRLDMEDSQRQFATAHAKRLKNKLMDVKVEEHLLKMVVLYTNSF